MHLSSEFGMTYREIESDGLPIEQKIEILLGADSAVSVGKAMGLALISFSEALDRIKPDLIVLLGDRFEIFAVAAASLVLRIPVAHIHGGELTEGAFDDALRHSVSKMSHLHLVAAPEYKKRLIQLGERPENVFVVGGLGVDGIKRVKSMAKPELEHSMNYVFAEKNLLVTFHPTTLEADSPEVQIIELLSALDSFPEIGLIFTSPNADTGGRSTIRRIEEFVAQRKNSVFISSLGQTRYFSCLPLVDGMLGNSSSGLLEMPTYQKGTINIGERQTGRLKAQSVIDCPPNREEIKRSITKLYSGEFQNMLKSVKNPYGDGEATRKIFDIIREFPLNGIISKKFQDLDFTMPVNA